MGDFFIALVVSSVIGAPLTYIGFAIHPVLGGLAIVFWLYGFLRLSS